MRRIVLVSLLAALWPAGARAQDFWRPEVGLRAAYIRFDDPNSSAYVDVFDLPLSNGEVVAPPPASLYGVVPIGGRFAFEPSFGLGSTAAFGDVFTTATVGLRFDVALTEQFYVGVGPTAYVVKFSGEEDTQGALEGALGYRRVFGPRMQGHAEVFYEQREKSEQLPELDVMGVRLGAGYLLRGSTPSPVEGTDRGDLWTPALVVQGGWTLASFPGQGDITSFTLPLRGQNLVGATGVLPGPSALAALFPVTERLAVEPSLDYHRAKPKDSEAVTSFQVGARLDYAFDRVFYAGAGAEGTRIKADGADTELRLIGVAAIGARFPMLGGLRGRTEVNYRVWGAGGLDDLPAGQATSFVFGALFPFN